MGARVDIVKKDVEKDAAKERRGPGDGDSLFYSALPLIMVTCLYFS